MPEQELHPAATKFIGSLVKSLQILCNGQVEFSESIELIGHINVRVDRKYKFDYIVDEQVSKEGEDASTTFLSNSYHSLHPHRQDRKKISGLEQDSKHEISQSTSQNTPKRSKQANNVAVFPVPRSSDGNCNDSQVKDLDNQNYTVSVESTSGAQISKENQMVVKLEEDEDSNDCMVLPASPDDYEAIGEMDEESRHDSFPISGSSGSHESQNAQTVSGRRRKKRKLQEQGARDSFESKVHDKSALHRDFDRYDSRNSPMASAAWSQTIFKSTSSPLGQSQQETYGDQNAAFSCGTCNITFLNWDSLGAHAALCPRGPKYLCAVCSANFNSFEDHREHMREAHHYIPCPHCNIWCPSPSAVKGHIHREHEPKFVCDLCGKTFHCKINYKGHMNMHSGAKPYSCIKCGKSFAYQQSKHAHQKLCLVTSPLS